MTRASVGQLIITLLNLFRAFVRLLRPIVQPFARIAYDILCWFFLVLDRGDSYRDLGDPDDLTLGAGLYVAYHVNHCLHHGELSNDRVQCLD